MDRLSELECFVRVVEQGGFTAAAKTLRITPSAVSKLLARLEDRLGARLLQRTTRRIALTTEGRIYYEQAREILSELAAADASIGGSEREPRGQLRVCLPHGFGMAQIVPLIPDFRARYPNVDLLINFTDHNVDLVSEGYDAGLRLMDTGEERLIARKLADYTRLICAAPSYIEGHGLPKHPRDLAGHRMLLSSSTDLLNRLPIRREDGGTEFITLPGAIATNSSDALYRFLRAGLGLAYASDFAVHTDITQGRLITVLDTWLAPQTWPIYVVYPERKHLAAKVRAFVDFLAERFSPQPPWSTAWARNAQRNVQRNVQASEAARKRAATSASDLSKPQTKR
ncbi:LysR family transcriptional regulator [Ferrovibrio sp.]|uniref:LysR family transcriptional regulator n=1 Tax=Ferrovibrio sp. TaxID=1917215 RepID=UPI0025BE21D8|nr:LysR family transcriptional regulator [Ferrovibrio sp.]MBX3455655.1 LysR family transcriptional regulator [Ferrovibrio sp.]